MLRLVHILTFAALLIYCSPLRACMLQQTVFGTNCHDQDVGVAFGEAVPTTEPVNGCVPHPESGDTANCVCEQPKHSPDRTHLDDLPADLPNPLGASVTHLHPLVVGDARDLVLHRPEAPPHARSLPLLN